MKEQAGSGRSRPKQYTEEFKRSAVDQWLSRGKTAVEVACDFGVACWNIRDWKRRYGPEAKPVDAACLKLAAPNSH
jgi:transposase-like protein